MGICSILFCVYSILNKHESTIINANINPQFNSLGIRCWLQDIGCFLEQPTQKCHSWDEAAAMVSRKNDGSTKDQLKKELPDGSAEIPPF